MVIHYSLHYTVMIHNAADDNGSYSSQKWRFLQEESCENLVFLKFVIFVVVAIVAKLLRRQCLNEIFKVCRGSNEVLITLVISRLFLCQLARMRRIIHAALRFIKETGLGRRI